MSYTIYLNEQQMSILRSALDFYERVLGLGQLEEIENQWRWHHNTADPDYQAKSNALRHSLYVVKAVGWGLSPNESRSIRSVDVPAEFRIAYDMQQVIRKSMSDSRIFRLEIEKNMSTARSLKMTVDQNEYWASCPEVPKIQVSFTHDS